MFSFICSSKNAWVNNREAGDLRRRRTHYDFIVMRYNHDYAKHSTMAGILDTPDPL